MPVIILAVSSVLCCILGWFQSSQPAKWRQIQGSAGSPPLFSFSHASVTCVGSGSASGSPRPVGGSRVCTAEILQCSLIHWTMMMSPFKRTFQCSFFFCAENLLFLGVFFIFSCIFSCYQIKIKKKNFYIKIAQSKVWQHIFVTVCGKPKE